uniref:Secreted protein n=1 Tax=Trichogramma kaykai TaxID=54128 RepID=A0ABD2X579_9HYME
MRPTLRAVCFLSLFYVPLCSLKERAFIKVRCDIHTVKLETAQKSSTAHSQVTHFTTQIFNKRKFIFGGEETVSTRKFIKGTDE